MSCVITIGRDESEAALTPLTSRLMMMSFPLIGGPVWKRWWFYFFGRLRWPLMSGGQRRDLICLALKADWMEQSDTRWDQSTLWGECEAGVSSFDTRERYGDNTIGLISLLEWVCICRRQFRLRIELDLNSKAGLEWNDWTYWRVVWNAALLGKQKEQGLDLTIYEDAWIVLVVYLVSKQSEWKNIFVNSFQNLKYMSPWEPDKWRQKSIITAVN